MAIIGHKSLAMFQRYSHPTQPHLKAPVEQLCQNGFVTNLGTPADFIPETTRKSLQGL